LSIEKGQYNTWPELFKIDARVHQVIDHIIPTEAAPSPDLKTTDPNLWKRLDDVVLQWIYDTISDDLLHTIIERDSTAEQAWNRLFNIFYDNKNSRALYLEQEFSNARIEQFPDASTYCQHLKSLSDQLSNVGTPVSNERLVLELISSLTEAYAIVGSQIHHGDSLPPFYKARSMIILEETTKAKKAATTVDNSVFLSSHDDASVSAGNNRNNNNNSRGSNPRGGRNNGRGGCGRGRSNGRGHSQPQQPLWFPSPYQQQSLAYPWPPWATPPCPYPTAGTPPKQSGILGPRPHQANLVTAPSVSTGQQAPQYYASTDIQAAMHTFSISLLMINGIWTAEQILI